MSSFAAHTRSPEAHAHSLPTRSPPRPPNSHSRPFLPVSQVRDLGSGEYELRLIVPLSGEFWLHVTHHKLHLHGSPLRLSIAPPSPGSVGANATPAPVAASDTGMMPGRGQDTAAASPRIGNTWATGRAASPRNGSSNPLSPRRHPPNPASPRYLDQAMAARSEPSSPRHGGRATPAPPSSANRPASEAKLGGGLMNILREGMLELPSPREPLIPRPFGSPAQANDVAFASAVPFASPQRGASPAARPGGSGLPGRVEDFGGRGMRGGGAPAAAKPPMAAASPRQPWRAGAASAGKPPPPPSISVRSPSSKAAATATGTATRLAYAAQPGSANVRSLALGDGLHRAAAGSAASFIITCKVSTASARKRLGHPMASDGHGWPRMASHCPRMANGCLRVPLLATDGR